MTRKVGNLVIIEPEPDGTCEMCGKPDELRPYGPNGERICFDCGMKDQATTDQKIAEMMMAMASRPIEEGSIPIVDFVIRNKDEKVIGTADGRGVLELVRDGFLRQVRVGDEDRLILTDAGLAAVEANERKGR